MTTGIIKLSHQNTNGIGIWFCKCGYTGYTLCLYDIMF